MARQEKNTATLPATAADLSDRELEGVAAGAGYRYAEDGTQIWTGTTHGRLP